jgi:ABC-type uncharacterized transport system permease subunit
MMLATLLPVALVAYIVGIFLASLGTFYRIGIARTGASLFFVVAWGAHVAAVTVHGVQTGHFPLSSRAEYLLFLGLAVMTLHLLLWFVWKVHATGIVLPPISAAAGFASWALIGTTASMPVAQPRGLFLFHTTVSTLGMATLVVALAMSLLYLFQDRALKARRKLKLLDLLPPLDRCDNIGFQALLVGFTLLSVGIATGVMVNSSLHDRLWVPGIKQTLPVLAWLVFAGVLAARFKLGFRGRKSAYLTITGVMLGLLTVAGMATL